MRKPLRGFDGNRGVIVLSVAMSILVLTLASLVQYPGFIGINPSGQGSSAMTSSFSSETSTTSPADTSATTSSLGTATAFGIFPCNCSVDLSQKDWPEYATIQDLVSASMAVIVGNVTSERTTGVNESFSLGGNVGLVPVTDYNISIGRVLLDRGYGVKPSYWTIVQQLGGTFGHTTMNVTGFPTLAVGASYIFFLTDQTSILGIYHGLTTTGAAQGLFYIQGGNVYSLDNAYPQADAWLPVKASGVPLADFIAQVQSAAGTNSSTVQK